MTRYTCRYEMLPMVEAILAAHGYVVEVPGRRQANGDTEGAVTTLLESSPIRVRKRVSHVQSAERPRHILVIAQGAEIRYTLAVLLARAGYAVTLVSDGQGAFAEVQCRRFDLVLLDLVESGQREREMALQLQEHLSSLGIVILSGSDVLSERAWRGPAHTTLRLTSPSAILAHVALAIVHERIAQVKPYVSL